MPRGNGGGGYGYGLPSDELLKPMLQLTFWKKLAIGSGHILNDLVGGMCFSYMLIFFQSIIQISAASAGYLMLLAQVADALATPVVGYEATETLFLCKSYGRCKSWHLLGCILVLISAPFIFLDCLECENTSDLAKMVYYSPFLVVSQLGWATVQIAHLALIPKMTPDELVRTEIIAIRCAFTVGANITVFILAFFILKSGSLAPEDSYLFTIISLATLLIGAIATIIFHLVVDEQPDKNVKESVAYLNTLPAIDKRRMSISESLQCSTSPILNVPFHARRRTSTIGTTGKYSEEARQALLHRNSLNPTATPFPSSSFSSYTLGTRGSDLGDDNEREQPTELSLNLNSSHLKVPTTHRRIRSNSIMAQLQHSLQVVNQSVQNLRPTNPLSTTWLSMGRDEMSPADWFKMFQFYMALTIYMMTRLSVNLSQVYVPLYLSKSLRLSVDTLATVPLTMYVCGLLATCCMKLLNKYVGRQLSFTFGAILVITGSLMIWNMDWETDPFMKKYAVYGVFALIGAGGSAMLVTSLSITADLIGSNVESGAFVYAAMSFVEKLSSGLGISYINYIAPCQIDDGSCDPEEVIPFYRDSLAISAGGTAFAGIIFVVILTIKIYIQNRGYF